MSDSMYALLLKRWKSLLSSLDDRGSPTVETVLIAAGLAALAIAVVAVILVKVMSVAHHIPTN
ncbi:MAG: hypothetical protein ACYDGN_12090 [Acidimicrobiales bacterium]